jgi:hypothetical protein
MEVRRDWRYARPCANAIVLWSFATLPLLPYAADHAGGLSHPLRYADEAIVDAAAVAVLALARPWRIERIRELAVVLAGLILFWALTDAWNLVSWQTPAVALRADLRFAGLGLLTAVGLTRNDRRRAAAVILASGALQALFAIGHSLGLGVRETTLTDYNQAGLFLMLCFLVAISGVARLGRVTTAALAVVLAGGIAATASRQAALGTVFGSLTVAFVRSGFRLRVATAGVTVAAAILLLLPTLLGSTNGTLAANGVTARWRELSTASFSPAKNFRAKLLVDNATFVAHHDPLLGVGFGTASAPAVIDDLTSPVYRSFLQRDLRGQVYPFVYDSNWAILVLETGFVGVALFVAFLGWLWSIGYRAAGDPAISEAGVALAGVVAALALAAFAGPAFREPLTSAILWFLIGATATSATGR